MVGCPPRALLRAALVAALAAPAAPARVALVALWLGDGTMPRYAATTCASLARPGGAAATLVLVVDDADRAGVPASCRGVDHVQIWELGAGGIARGLAAGAARSPARGEARAAVEALVVKTLAAKPRVVIELKPLWLYAWRDELRAAGFDRASYADLGVVFGTSSRGSRRATARRRDGGSAAPAARNFEPLGGPGCPTVLPARPGDRYVSAEACYSCAFFSAVTGDEAAAFSARFAGLAGSGGFDVAEARALLAPLSVLTLPAVFSDHALDRVCVRCAPGGRRAAALDGGGALAFRPLASPGDGAVVEAAMFHFRIWSDRRDGLFGPFRDGAAPVGGGAFAVDEDGFLDAKARKPGFAADVLAGRAWDGGAVPCAANSTLRPAALVQFVGGPRDAVEAAARALEGVATVAAFDALHGFVHKKLPPAPRNLRAAKQPKFHYDGFGDGARWRRSASSRARCASRPAGPSGRF
ncbi:hypothetical protein JL720_19 [Aureococcus anophagefferens]|nr:hypothetical protein JL720_19 [Aureococcus anophagefferens]